MMDADMVLMLCDTEYCVSGEESNTCCYVVCDSVFNDNILDNCIDSDGCLRIQLIKSQKFQER